MANINDQAPEFLDFMFEGLDHGIFSISDAGGPLTPFLITQTGDQKELKRFVTERLEDGITNAEIILTSMSDKPAYALIAFDGFINWENKKCDAIIVKAFDKTQDEGFQFYQRYVPKSDGSEGIEPIGNPGVLGKTPNLLLATVNHNIQPNKEEKKRPWWKF